MRRHHRVTIWAIFLIFLVGCAPKFSEVPPATFDTWAVITPEVQKERDQIYMLAAYAVVYNDWQDGSGVKRCHNIGSVLVDPNGTVNRGAEPIPIMSRIKGATLVKITLFHRIDPIAA